MTFVNIHEAKTTLSKLIEAIESGRETEITIARNGKPAARLVPILPRGHVVKLGLAEGKFKLPDNFDDYDAEIERLFNGDPS